MYGGGVNVIEKLHLVTNHASRNTGIEAEVLSFNIPWYMYGDPLAFLTAFLAIIRAPTSGSNTTAFRDIVWQSMCDRRDGMHVASD